MRILLVTDTYPPDLNGVADHTRILAEELVKRGHEVAVATLDDKTTSGYENGFFVYRLKGHVFRLSPEITYRVRPPTRWLKRIALDFNPDIIHVHSPSSLGIAGYYVARDLNLPVVATYHTHLSAFGKTIIKTADRLPRHLRVFKLGLFQRVLEELDDRLLEKWVLEYYGAVDRIIAPSKEMYRYLVSRGIPEEKIRVVENFIEMYIGKHMSGNEFRRKWGLSKDDKVVLHVGRLSWEKRVWLILDIAEKMPDVKFVITSRGPVYDYLNREIKHRKLNNVILTGFLEYPELYGAFEASDVLITLSKGETFNLSAAQAMLFGKPIIASRGGVVEFLEHGKNGFIIDEEGSKEIEAFVEKIRLLLDNKDLRERMGSYGKKIASRYTREAVIDKMIKVYSEVLADWSLGKRPSLALKYKAIVAFSLIYALRI